MLTNEGHTPANNWALMGLSLIDWVIIGGYCALSLGVGVYFSRRAGKDIREFFISGSTLPWWLLGTSMVATTFGADTPLAVTEYVRNDGIWRNWFWWNVALGGLLGVFLFSRLWRRAEVLTDNELIEMRYSGRPAMILRAFKAGYFSTIYNFVVMGWVIQAMATILQVVLGIPAELQWISIAFCVCIALGYAVLSGFWGVVVTDMFQFLLCLASAIVLAIYSLDAVGGIEELKRKLAETNGGTDITMNFFPPLQVTGDTGFLDSPLFMFIIFITMMWWSSHNADGGGYIIQRMLSAKNEAHSLIGTLWFNVAHYALRPWPWIIVALVTMVTFPEISRENSKDAYPAAINAFLPHGLRGMLVASFLAAFMSTIDTHLNWGTSYFINDIYRRFIRPTAPARHYVLVSRITIVVLMVMAGLVASQMNSITAAWEFLLPMSAGIGLVLILRWFWWRINAWSEISALIASVIINIPLVIMDVAVQYRFMVIVPFSIIVWVSVTFLTKPVPRETLMKFYTKVRPGGAWGPVRKKLPHIKRGILGWGLLVEWFSGVALIYGATFGIGKLIFHEYTVGAVLLGISFVGGGVIIYRLTRKEVFS